MRYCEHKASSDERQLWQALLEHQDEVFLTAKGLEFTYAIRGNELFVSRKRKSISRSTVDRAYGNAQVILRAGGSITGPKQLGTLGASYIYPVFRALGLLDEPVDFIDEYR